MAFTGGTGDILPQTLTIKGTKTTATATYDVTQISLPVPRIGTARARATVFELLWVDWYLDIENIEDVAIKKIAYLSTSSLRKTGDTFSLATAVDDIGDPRTIAPVLTDREATGSAGSSYVVYPIRVPLTDTNGNGILVATDKIFITSADLAGAAGTTVCKVCYRLVNVDTMEYVGIVQSQIS